MDLRLGWILVAHLFVSSVAIAEDYFGFSTSGYLRYGFGYTHGAVGHACYGARGAHGVSRFGNECNQYMDFQLKHDLGDKDNGIYLHSELGWDFFAEEGREFSLIGIDERFFQVGGLGVSRASAWFGRRTYRRKEAHLLDFKYSNLWGNGFGFEDVAILGLNIAYAKISRPPVADGKYTSHIIHDLRAYDIPFNLGLESPALVELSVNYAGLKLSPDYFHQENKVDGFSLSILLHQDFNGEISNSTSVQLGYAALADLSSGISLRKDGQGNLIHPSGYRSYRIVNETLFEDLEAVSLMLTQVVEKRVVSGLENSDFLWISFGGRVIIYQSKHLNYVVDGSFDHVRDDLQPVGSWVKKMTAAIQFSKDRGFYSRPALRIYATYADSRAESDSFPGDKLSESGLSFGVQFETWW